MANNNWDMIEKNDLSKNSKGGTELALERIFDGYISRDVLEQFQIIPSRVREINENKFRIYIIQDLVGDPEVDSALRNEGWNKFHFIIFVTHWQAQRFIEAYNIPWSKVLVIQNAVSPIEIHTKPNPKEQVNIIYHTTPHRGLNILLTVWDAICNNNENVHLDVYSSFNLYGWGQRDEQFKQLFDFCKEHPHITYHGSVSNEEVREAQKKAHIFAYPSIWQETSCQIAGAKILTKDGVKNIEDIKVGDYVLSHKGRFRKVTELFNRHYNGKLYGLKAVGSQQNVYFTSDHLIYAGFNFSRNDASGKRRYTNKLYKTGWIQANKLKSDIHSVLRPKGVFGNIESINLIDYIDQENYHVAENGFIEKTERMQSNRYKIVENKQNLTEEFAFIMGLFAGDGSSSVGYGNIEFAYNIKEQESVEKVKKFFGESVTYKQTSENGCSTVYYNKIWAMFFQNTIGVGKTKHIPSFIWEAPKNIQKSFIEGYYAADGSKTFHPSVAGETPSKSIDTISESLAYGLSQLLTNIGYFSGIRFDEKVNAYTVQWRENPKKKYFVQNEEYIGAPISDIDVIHHNGLVYNIEVDEDHSYSTENILAHNCMCLMEAMSAKLICVHPDYGALPETAANWTMMYHWHESLEEHAKIFGNVLDNSIKELRGPMAENLENKLLSQKNYADIFYNWENRRMQWEGFLKSIIQINPPKEFPQEQFVYRSN